MLSCELEKEELEWVEFGRVELCFRGIKILNRVGANVRFISALTLDGNYLMSLRGIEQFYNLELLHFNYNLVSLPSELTRIHNPFYLRDLSFIANPIFYLKNLTLDHLRGSGFTRLEKINTFSHPSSPHLERFPQVDKEKKAKETSMEVDVTVRRVPSYKRTQEDKTHRKSVGKIYVNPKFYTARRQVQKPPHNTKQTRDSTIRNSFEASGHSDDPPLPEAEEGKQKQQIRPFWHSDETAQFSPDTPRQKLGQEFLNQQKLRLAELYYRRSRLQSWFNVHRKGEGSRLEQEMEPYLGEIVNNELQTMHFSLIKLKHEFSCRK